jgi:hypothetical protein
MRGVAGFAAGVVLSAAMAMPSRAAHAQDCPTVQSARQGFVVERGDQTKTEVFYDAPIVRTVMRFGGTPLLETTQYEGLFQLDRVDRGRRTSFRPTEELAPLVPNKVGQRVTVQFDVSEAAGRATKSKVALSVIGQDSLYIGACRYDVLKIDRHESRGEGALAFINTDYYAPLLKLVIAKEYRERQGQRNLVKFDRIYSGKP